MLLASGVNFGFKRTIPHMLGIAGGFWLMVLLVGVGLGQVFNAYPFLFVAMKWLGGAYMLYLAWNIAMSTAPTDTHDIADAGSSNAGSAKPMSFLAAAAFQYVNPKAWIMAIGGISAYLPTGLGFWQTASAALLIASVFATINLPSVSVWTLFGTALRGFLALPVYRQAFNWTMAVLLVVSYVPALMV